MDHAWELQSLGSSCGEGLSSPVSASYSRTKQDLKKLALSSTDTTRMARLCDTLHVDCLRLLIYSEVSHRLLEWKHLPRATSLDLLPLDPEELKHCHRSRQRFARCLVSLLLPRLSSRRLKHRQEWRRSSRTISPLLSQCRSDVSPKLLPHANSTRRLPT
jgi:hypothetical protein